MRKKMKLGMIWLASAAFWAGPGHAATAGCIAPAQGNPCSFAGGGQGGYVAASLSWEIFHKNGTAKVVDFSSAKGSPQSTSAVFANTTYYVRVMGSGVVWAGHN